MVLYLEERRQAKRDGLGAYPTVKLAKARKLAEEYREAVAEGRDPITFRRRNSTIFADESRRPDGLIRSR